MANKPTTYRALLETDSIHPSPHNPRKYHDPTAHEELKRSLATIGQLAPILVRLSPHTPKAYEIVCGERRWRAAKELGWPRIEAIYDSRLNGNQQLTNQATAAENTKRSALNPYEETIATLTLLADKLTTLKGWPNTDDPITTTANIMKRFVDRSPTTQQTIANELKTTPKTIQDAINEACGTGEGLKPTSFVRNKLPLLTLPDDVHQALESGRAPYPVAVQIARVPDPTIRATLLDLATKHSVREMQDIIRTHKNTDPDPTDRKAERSNKAKQMLAEIYERRHQLENLDYNATTAVINSFKRVLARL